MKAVQHATLILRCHAADAGEAPVAAANEIIVVTKCDLLGAELKRGQHNVSNNRHDPVAARTGGESHLNNAANVVHTSAKNKIGLKELAHAVSAALSSSGISNTGEGMALAQRHRALLAASVIDIQQALAAAAVDETRRHLSTPELVASAMHSALENLGGIAGRMTPDDILGRIFSRFCVGK